MSFWHQMPTGSQRVHDVETTSHMTSHRRHFVASTSLQPRTDVICLLGMYVSLVACDQQNVRHRVPLLLSGSATVDGGASAAYTFGEFSGLLLVCDTTLTGETFRKILAQFLLMYLYMQIYWMDRWMTCDFRSFSTV